jgi:uncharacterized membrane protein
MRTLLKGLVVAAGVAFCATSVRAEDEGSVKRLFEGPHNSLVQAINNKGDAVGTRHVPGSSPGVETEEQNFYQSGGKTQVMPLLDGYTALFPQAISDNGLAVGRVMKPMKTLGDPGYGNIQAFIWNAKTGKTEGLGIPRDFERSLAYGITPDGTRISGVVGGAGKTCVCIWDKTDNGWRSTILPGNTRSELNVTSGPAISNDGSFVVGIDDYKPCLWKRQADGSWKQTVIEELFVPKSVNDSGTIVGYRRFDNDGNYRAVSWTARDGMKDLGVLPGTRSSQAFSINNKGMIVGVSDEPGPDGGPQPFISDGRTMKLLPARGVIVGIAYAINDRGQVAGFYGCEDDEYVPAFIWSPGK